MRNKPFQCKRDKMYTMSAFDPTLIILVNIYADQFSARQDTRVYANGAMQVSIFISVNYNGDTDEGILDQIKGYVQDHVVIYTLDDGKVKLDTSKWIKSTEENDYHHDIDHAGDNVKLVSDIRVPLYFTVPVGSEGEHRWIASLDGKETSTKTPVVITVKAFSVTTDDLEIVNKASVDCHQMRALKYKHGVFPDVQKLMRLVDYKGIKFIGTGGNSWVSMAMSSKGHKLGVFIEYKVMTGIKIAKPVHQHWPHEMVKKSIENSGKQNAIYGDCLINSIYLHDDDIKEAWNDGIVMVMVHHMAIKMYKYSYSNVAAASSVLDYRLNDFIIEDNFGNRMKFNINWDESDWYGNWAVHSITKVYP